MRGFKCQMENCNCEKLCENGDIYEKFTVLKEDDIVMFDKKLESGTYCLPKGLTACNQKNSIPIFSSSGWLCASRNDEIWQNNHMVACKNEFAEDNSLNILWDYKLNQMASQQITNFYEKINNKTYRFKCKCNSLDIQGNKMINTLPFTCSVDYCLKDLRNQINLGWDGEKCNCGVYPHKDEKDPTSECMFEKTRIENNVLIGRIECMTSKSLTRKPIHCPSRINAPVIRFENKIHNSDIPSNFVLI
ncbi:uncharacterized protein TNIN_179561 [Trichonephila inaurata madagascariensis]|uniref:Uncharacterized protein n=1 Tax=Trichonephila inaurata madagascariensis TaxID=2747483 RepID=A0A8X6Y7E3_9ARAC|nr:uncharacterized protein TNIN_179561 [Trichonephila inaurata madagascariensis]